MITPDKKEEILAAAKNEEVIGEFITLTQKGKDLKGDCPICKAKGKFTISPSKKIYKCFSCDWAGKDPIKFLIDAKGMSFPDALLFLADKYKIITTEVPKGPQKKSKTTYFQGYTTYSIRDHMCRPKGHCIC